MIERSDLGLGSRESSSDFCHGTLNLSDGILITTPFFVDVKDGRFGHAKRSLDRDLESSVFLTIGIFSNSHGISELFDLSIDKRLDFLKFKLHCVKLLLSVFGNRYLSGTLVSSLGSI